MMENDRTESDTSDFSHIRDPLADRLDANGQEVENQYESFYDRMRQRFISECFIGGGEVYEKDAIGA